MSSNHSRILAVVIGTLTLLRSAPATEQPSPPPTVILVIADLHVTNDASLDEFKQVIAFANNVIHPAFTYIAGDTPDGGTLQQYQLYKRAMDTLKGPVYNVLGDHEAKSGGAQHYRAILGQPTYSFDHGQYHFTALDSMSLEEQQFAWARTDLLATKQKNLTSIVFIHHDLPGIKDKAAQQKLTTLLGDCGVRLVLSGHTHTNSVVNDGGRLLITTTSLTAPRGNDSVGYALVTLDQGRIAWHYIPLGQRPVVAICSPISRLMTTGPEGVVRGRMVLRVKAFDDTPIKSMTASIDDGPAINLKVAEDNLWTGGWDSTTVADGPHTLKVEAATAAGETAAEQITILVNQAGTYAASPASESDAAGPGGGPGKKGPKDKPGGKQPVESAEVPAPALDALKKQAGEAQFNKLEKEIKEGVELYIAKWDVEDKEHEAKVAADGRVVELKEIVVATGLPVEVRLAVEAELPGAINLEYKKKTEMIDGKQRITYEVKGDVDGKKQNMKVAADGTMVKGPKKPPKAK